MPAQVFHGVQGFELATATSTSAASTASGGGGLDIGALALIILGGISSGLFTTPMNFMPTWEWENVWVVYCIWGMLVLPWLLVFVTIPDLHEVYSAATSQELIETIVFGAMWGLGSVTFGIGTNIVGNSLGFSIILGLTSTLGSGIVMVALHPKEVTSPEGIYNWVALCVTVFGLVILGYAGIKKEQDQERASSAGLLQKERMTSDDDKPSFVVGLLVCLLSGALSPCLNLSLSFGHPIQVMTMNSTIDGHAVAHLAKDSPWSNNPVWSIGVAAGFTVNFVFCLWKLAKNGSGTNFCSGEAKGFSSNGSYNSWDVKPWYYATEKSSLGNWVWTFVMGMLWFGGNILYGVGANKMGSLGTAVGWPVFMIAMIITGNISGMVFGEWANTTSYSKSCMVLAIAVLCIAVIISAVGSTKPGSSSPAAPKANNNGHSGHSGSMGGLDEWDWY